MSLHKLTAGSGYDYLTRQVAALDATEKGHIGLASYYTERGETPGVWIGSGMDGIDGLAAGDPVTAEQMRALFGCGLHPLAELRQQQLEGPDLTLRDFQNAARLGVPFKIVDNDRIPFRVEVAKRIAALNTAIGVPADASIAAADRARVRTQVAREFFLSEHGREPVNARELAGQIAKDSRPRTQTVAGYDLTFSPVKSVSSLWAVADPAVGAVIERAHQAAVQDALTFIEKHALFTRTGPQGIRQVNVRGLVAAAFTHRDSRAGDPDLHTHVAVANKVQTLDGRWLSIDGRVLFKANIAASETYNTALEQHLRAALGVRFAERPGTDPGKRPIREIVGVDPRLNRRWSTRRAHIETRRGELAIQFQHDHGRPPTPVEALHLAQQATLETRDAKHEPRSLTEQRATWLSEAAAVLGSSEAVASMVRTVLAPPAEATAIADARWVAQTANHTS
jgi:conjugative relaxase-like TrwC/TraI family protein